MSNSLSSRPQQLALNRKSRVCIISEKEDNLVRYTQIFEHIFREISVPFGFHPGISRIFGNSTISGFSGTFPWKFSYRLSPFWKFRNFWSNGKRPKTTKAWRWYKQKKLIMSILLLTTKILNGGYDFTKIQTRVKEWSVKRLGMLCVKKFLGSKHFGWSKWQLVWANFSHFDWSRKLLLMHLSQEIKRIDGHSYNRETQQIIYTLCLSFIEQQHGMSPICWSTCYHARAPVFLVTPPCLGKATD